uniref:C-type lectin domain-containing protein n=1 Tax=Scleropages formosus TaxID=113540 RepID=A0A8C9SJV3_SCLFO
FATSFQFADGGMLDGTKSTLRCDPVPEMRCPSTDWHEYGDFCYKPFTDLKTWHAARSECRKLEADLVSILSIAEQTETEKQYFCYDPVATGDVWTGLNDLEFQGFFTWSDQHEVQFTYWAPGEPNNHDGFKEDCVEMWNDVPCTEINEYICKKPKLSVKRKTVNCFTSWTCERSTHCIHTI